MQPNNAKHRIKIPIRNEISEVVIIANGMISIAEKIFLQEITTLKHSKKKTLLILPE